MSRPSLLPLRALRLSPRADFERFVGGRGEIYYDSVNDTLRVFNSEIQGGQTLATRSWVESQNYNNYLNLTNRPDLKAVATSGDYNDLINKPNLGFSGSWNDLTDKPTLFSGSWNDLSNKPTVFSGSWNDLSNKPSLFSGSYLDLSNKPSSFSGLSSLSFSKGVSVDEFSTDVTLSGESNSAVPTELAVKTYVDTAISGVELGSLSLSDLTDTQITAPITVGHVLKWNGTRWAPAVDATVGGGGTDAATLNGQNGAYYLNYDNFSNTPDLTLYAPKNNPTFTGTITGTLSGNASTATRWQTTRTISLTGDISGSANIDGSGNISISTTINGNSVDLGTDTNGQYARTIQVVGTGITVTAALPSDGTDYVITSTATSENTNSAIVQRDSSGSFSANSITVNSIVFPTGTQTAPARAPGMVLVDSGIIGQFGPVVMAGNINLRTAGYRRYRIYLGHLRHNSTLCIGVRVTNNSGVTNNQTQASYLLANQIQDNGGTITQNYLRASTVSSFNSIAEFTSASGTATGTDIVIDVEYSEYNNNSGVRCWRVKYFSVAHGQGSTGNFIQNTTIDQNNFVVANSSAIPGFVLTGAQGLSVQLVDPASNANLAPSYAVYGLVS